MQFQMGNDITVPNNEAKNMAHSGMADNLVQPGVCAERPPGFIHSSAIDLHNTVERVSNVTNRLNELAARTIGRDMLPKNQREIAAEKVPTRDEPRPVESDSERLIGAQKRMYLAVEELEEIAHHLEQL